MKARAGPFQFIRLIDGFDALGVRAWFMLMSGYVAWKLTDSADIMEEIRARPPNPPPALHGRSTERPPDPPAPVMNADGTVVTNQAEINAATAGSVMVADLLTKSVARAMFVELMRLLSEYSRTGQSCPSSV